jgi:hypothetical protein
LNFRFTEFSDVRLYSVVRSSAKGVARKAISAGS